MKGVTAIVAAAGQGTRLGLGPKAFVKIGGMTLIEWVVSTLEPVVDRVIVAVPKGRVNEAQLLIGNKADVITGLSSRQSTIGLLLEHVNTKWVVIHDATRPFATENLIAETIAQVKQYKAVGTFIPNKVPIGLVGHSGMITDSISSSDIKVSQSPQAYETDLLKTAYEIAQNKDIEEQTTWQLLLKAMGNKVFPISGEEFNIKITTPIDLKFAHWLLENDEQLKQRSQK